MDSVPHRPRVLVVDDDARSAQLLARLLREDGYDVEVAFNGVEAIARLSRAPAFDVLVTDLRMPRADGLAVVQVARIRSPRMQVFVVTAYPELVDKRAFDPPLQVFPKPIAYPSFVEALRAPFLAEKKS